MSDQREIIEGTVQGAASRALAPARDEVVYAPEAAEPGAGQLLLWLHLMLRGRYIVLVILSAVLGVALGYGGFRLGYKTYRSTGLIQIVKPLKVTQAKEDENASDLEGFVSTQAGLLKSRRVMDEAMQNPDWQALHRPKDDKALDDFAQSLAVLPKDRMIYVTFEDRDANAAGVTLRAVIGAYRQLYIDEDRDAQAKRMRVLQDRQTSLTLNDKSLASRIDAIAEVNGTNDLSGIYQTKRSTADRLNSLLDEIKMRIALAPTTNPSQPTQASQDLTGLLDRLEIEELAQKDSSLRDLLSERSRLERSLRDLTTINGYGETHPRVLAEKKKLDLLEDDISARAMKVREMLKRVRPSFAGAANMDLGELKLKLQYVTQLRDNAETEAVQAGQENLKLQGLKDERASNRRELEALTKWISDLNLQQLEGSRIKVISEGTTPSSAQSDTRVRFAALGAMAGLLVGFGLVLLPAAADRRFRAADETKIASYLGPVLGVLPELPGGLFDDEHAAMAAHCVHQTRTLLQMRHDGNQGQVLAVTSSLAGTGKTSLTLALGVSFATSGSRTLIVDCDLVGGGLSARVSRIMRRKIGYLLRRDGLMTEAQLQQALARAQGTRRPLGEVCVEMGFVQEADVKRALDSQDAAHMGVLEALAGESLEDCVAETGFPGLSILPLGTASARHCASISPMALRRLLNLAKGRFDTVLVDTGPVPGSLEASVVVPEVEGVVLVVSKGEHRPSVARCTEYLRSLNATPMGVVFNRASVKEVSLNSSTLHRSTAAFGSSSGMGLKVDAEQSRRSDRLGPMAQAVAGCAPTDGEDKA
jgi:Mrp family chromosome partitioning ATPase/uncharacterized protein involved in exopolysaccharide biosynthesis